MKKRLFAVIVFLYLQSINVSSQEWEELQTQAEIENDPLFFINSFIINVDGKTRTYLIEDICKLKTGEKIKGLSGLEQYINEKKQLLENERVFEDINVEYSTGRKKNGEYPVDITISVKDSHNNVLYPRPKYSSKTGYDIRLKMRDYNFLGTLQSLKMDLGYIYDQFQRRYFLFILDTSAAFNIFDLKWNLNFINEFQYRPDLERVFYYGNTTGLSVNLPVKSTNLLVGLNESFYINLENEDKYKPLYGDTQEGFFISNNPYMEWKIPTGIEIGNLGELYYTPYISFIYNLEFSRWPLDDIKKYPELDFGYSVGFDNINWINNFRKGSEIIIDNGYEYSFRSKKYNQRALDINIAFTAINHFILKNDLLGISFRFQFRHWFYSFVYEEAGDALRGIKDDELFANSMISLNLDFPVKIIEFRPSKWYKNEKLKIIDLDLHLSPIIDIAFFKHPENQIINMKNILLTGGIEALVFPLKFRAFTLRASFGYNFSEILFKNQMPALSSKYEIFIGAELFY